MMGNDASPNEMEDVDPIDLLYGLFSGEDFLTDLETEHKEEIVRDERITQELAITVPYFPQIQARVVNES